MSTALLLLTCVFANVQPVEANTITPEFIVQPALARDDTETPPVAAHRVGIKNCDFLFLTKSISSVYNSGGKSFYRVSTPLITPVPRGALATSTPKEQARLQILEIVEGPDFKSLHTVTYWRLKDRAQNSSNWFEKWLQDLFAKSGNKLNPETLKTIALVFEILLWAIVAAVIALILYQYRNTSGLFKHFTAKAKSSSPDKPKVLFGLDVTPQSLPKDISAAVQILLQEGNYRSAIGLLYRACLSHFINARHIPLHPALTELECQTVVASGEPDVKINQFLVRVTQAWLDVAYAHRTPRIEQLQGLCTDWNSLFTQEPSRND